MNKYLKRLANVLLFLTLMTAILDRFGIVQAQSGVWVVLGLVALVGTVLLQSRENATSCHYGR